MRTRDPFYDPPGDPPGCLGVFLELGTWERVRAWRRRRQRRTGLDEGLRALSRMTERIRKELALANDQADALLGERPA